MIRCNLHNPNETLPAERERVNALASWYSTKQLDFDRRMIGFRHDKLRPHLVGPEGLELGPADGEMTRLLLPGFRRLTVVDAAADLLAKIPEHVNLIKVNSLFEDFDPHQSFNTVLMEHILEHVVDPGGLLRRAAVWLAPRGKLLVGVPNGSSVHRLAAVKMGLLSEPCELTPRDLALGHRRVYTPETFRTEIERAGLRIVEFGGVFFKPLSNQQMQDHWTEEMIRGFYELGKDFPQLAAELYAVCVVS